MRMESITRRAEITGEVNEGKIIKVELFYKISV